MLRQKKKLRLILACIGIAGVALAYLVVPMINYTDTYVDGLGNPICDAVLTGATPDEISTAAQQYPEFMNHPDLMGYYPIHRAVLSNSEKVIHLFISEGADINQISDGLMEDTPLHIAVAYDDIEVDTIHILLDSGADPQLNHYRLKPVGSRP